MEVENRIFHDGVCGPDVVPAKEIHPVELVPYLDVHEDVVHEHMDARSVLTDDLVVEVIAGRREFLFNLVRRTYHEVGMVLFGQCMQVAQAVGCHQVVRIEEIEILASGLFEGDVSRQSRSRVLFLPQDPYAMAPGMRGHQMLHDVDASVGAAVVARKDRRSSGSMPKASTFRCSPPHYTRVSRCSLPVFRHHWELSWSEG